MPYRTNIRRLEKNYVYVMALFANLVTTHNEILVTHRPSDCLENSFVSSTVHQKYLKCGGNSFVWLTNTEICLAKYITN